MFGPSASPSSSSLLADQMNYDGAFEALVDANDSDTNSYGVTDIDEDDDAASGGSNAAAAMAAAGALTNATSRMRTASSSSSSSSSKNGGHRLSGNAGGLQLSAAATAALLLINANETRQRRSSSSSDRERDRAMSSDDDDFIAQLRHGGMLAGLLHSDAPLAARTSSPSSSAASSTATTPRAFRTATSLQHHQQQQQQQQQQQPSSSASATAPAIDAVLAPAKLLDLESLSDAADELRTIMLSPKPKQPQRPRNRAGTIEEQPDPDEPDEAPQQQQQQQQQQPLQQQQLQQQPTTSLEPQQAPTQVLAPGLASTHDLESMLPRDLDRRQPSAPLPSASSGASSSSHSRKQSRALSKSQPTSTTSISSPLLAAASSISTSSSNSTSSSSSSRRRKSKHSHSGQSGAGAGSATSAGPTLVTELSSSSASSGVSPPLSPHGFQEFEIPPRQYTNSAPPMLDGDSSDEFDAKASSSGTSGRSGRRHRSRNRRDDRGAFDDEHDDEYDDDVLIVRHLSNSPRSTAGFIIDEELELIRAQRLAAAASAAAASGTASSRESISVPMIDLANLANKISSPRALFKSRSHTMATFNKLSPSSDFRRSFSSILSPRSSSPRDVIPTTSSSPSSTNAPELMLSPRGSAAQQARQSPRGGSMLSPRNSSPPSSSGYPGVLLSPTSASSIAAVSGLPLPPSATSGGASSSSKERRSMGWLRLIPRRSSKHEASSQDSISTSTSTEQQQQQQQQQQPLFVNNSNKKTLPIRISIDDEVVTAQALRITSTTTASQVVVRLLRNLSMSDQSGSCSPSRGGGGTSSSYSPPSSVSPSSPEYINSYWLVMLSNSSGASRFFEPDEVLWKTATNPDISYHLSKIDRTTSRTPWDTLTGRVLQLERENAALRQQVAQLQDEAEADEVANLSHPSSMPMRSDITSPSVSPGRKQQPAQQQAPSKLSISLTNWQKGTQLSHRGGSNAIVYTAFIDGWSCAVKEVCIEHPSDAEAMTNEINILERLPPHHNVVRYLFHTLTDNILRLFMTRYDTSLRSYLGTLRERKTPPKPRVLKSILNDMISGLAHLHKHNIIHRDVKTDNIFITFSADGEVSRCVVGDFDTAKIISRSSQPTTVRGTPSYTAPEVLTSEDNVAYNVKADIYSFGMVLYELLSLNEPYSECTSMVQISRNIISGTRPSLPTMDPCYAPFISLFYSCTETSQRDRPTSKQLRKKLRALVIE